MEAAAATAESGQCFEQKKTDVAVTYNNRGGNEKKEDGKKLISGLLDGSGEYNLVYEDNEGDRMLVGDVPWQ
ncbi:hypothetical protein RDI58_029074 [Solanum bulbocastanum]|uniref:Auxin-responsive protein n=1 Tax=Solanum bulbocastanum TaxID=147425 RepID=A0AAN8ST13_SOLBU